MKYRIIYILFVLPAIFSSSCTKWLDVQPKTNISERVLFEDEQGFKDALTGVYTQLASEGLYAREFTMATMDVLAQNYDVSANTNNYYETGQYNYEDSGVQGRINTFWNSGYRAIANLNNLLEAIDEKQLIFTSGNYERIKGEALGLRAFLHFDLFRAFGPIPKVNIQEKSLPYVTKFSMKVSENLPGNDFLDSCMLDLDQAIELLAVNKTVSYGLADLFQAHTRNHMNYWAAHGLKARIALYRDDREVAYQSAKVVIDNANLFPFIDVNNLVSSAPSRTFLSEQLFGIYVPTLQSINDAIFKSGDGTSSLTNNDGFIQRLFEGSTTDYRSVFLWKFDGTALSLFPAKYREDDIQTSILNSKRVPLIRLSEVCYIAAEATDDLSIKVGLLNLVRSNRGLGDLSEDLSAEQLDAEIYKEYRKEFYQEGQLFFYYKRTNTLRIENVGDDMTANQYVFPKPIDELEYNNL